MTTCPTCDYIFGGTRSDRRRHEKWHDIYTRGVPMTLRAFRREDRWSTGVGGAARVRSNHQMLLKLSSVAMHSRHASDWLNAEELDVDPARKVTAYLATSGSRVVAFLLRVSANSPTLARLPPSLIDVSTRHPLETMDVEEDDWATLHSGWVHPTYRRRHIAQSLILSVRERYPLEGPWIWAHPIDDTGWSFIRAIDGERAWVGG